MLLNCFQPDLNLLIKVLVHKIYLLISGHVNI